MTPIYLFDTGVVSLPVKPRADRSLANRFERIAGSGCISATTLCELLYGAIRLPAGSKRTDLQDYLKEVLLTRVLVLD